MSDADNVVPQSGSTNEESQTRGDGGDHAESDNSEHPSINQFDVPIDERSAILRNSEHFLTRLPLNDGGDSDEFGATDVVEQILLFGCGLGSSLCCKFFLSVFPFP